MKVNFEWEILFERYKKIQSSFKAWKKISDKLESYSSETFKEISKPDENKLSEVESVSWQEFTQIIFEDIKYEWAIEDYEVLVQTYRKSGVLTIYSILENHLKSLAKLVEVEFDFKIRISDLKGDGYIDQYFIFLCKVFELKVESIEPSWTKLKQRRIIRNKIAHNAVFSKNEISKITNLRGITEVPISAESSSFLIDESFIHQLIDTCEDFFISLLFSIDSRYTELRS